MGFRSLKVTLQRLKIFAYQTTKLASGDTYDSFPTDTYISWNFYVFIYFALRRSNFAVSLMSHKKLGSLLSKCPCAQFDAGCILINYMIPLGRTCANTGDTMSILNVDFIATYDSITTIADFGFISADRSNMQSCKFYSAQHMVLHMIRDYIKKI